MTPERTSPRSRKRPVSIKDLTSLKFLAGGDASPDGSHYAFIVRQSRENQKGYDAHIYVVSHEGELRRFTVGKRSDGAPIFSPDGELMAFVAKRGKNNGIHMLPAGGGEAWPLVERDGSFSELAFSPDGTRLACIYRPNDPPPGADPDTSRGERDDDDTPRKREEPVFRHITRPFYRLDGEGFLPQAEGHVWVFDLATREGTRITGGKRGASSPTFSPDGRRIAYVMNMRPDPDLEMNWQELFTIPAKGGKAKQISTPPGPLERPVYSPDGKTIAYLGHDDLDAPWYENFRVWTVPADGRGQARCLCPAFDSQPTDDTITDSSAEGFFMLSPTWSPDGRWIYFVSSAAGSTRLHRVRARGGKPEAITHEKQHLQSIALSADCRTAYGTVSTPTMPQEVFAFDIPSGEQRRVTSLNTDWAKRRDIQKPKRVVVKSADGTRVDAWLLTPPGFSERKKYPAIIEVHGGPMTQYGYSFFHEMQVLAARGYVVYYSNPRGSAGYGRAFAEAIKGDWGGPDFADVMAGADYLESLAFVDVKRIGITGGSYGGFMTNWAVGHTRRFKAAVTQRSVVDLIPFFGSSDVGYEFYWELGGKPWEDRDGWERQSPLTYAKNIRTPLLIIHSEQDLRCGIEQAENLFATLKSLKRTTELIRFPEESHGLSRGGRPDRRIARLEKIVEWFDRYM